MPLPTAYAARDTARRALEQGRRLSSCRDGDGDDGVRQLLSTLEDLCARTSAVLAATEECGEGGGDAERDWMAGTADLDTDAEISNLLRAEAAAYGSDDECRSVAAESEASDDLAATPLVASFGETRRPSDVTAAALGMLEGTALPRTCFELEPPGSPTRQLYGRAIGTQPTEAMRAGIADVSAGWGRCVLALQATCGGHALAMVGADLMETHRLRSALGLDAAKMGNCLARLERDYGASNPYHNSAHAADVLVATHLFLVEFSILPVLEPHMVLAALWAAIIHDFNHPGTSNNFEVKMASRIALRHSDSSVLERHHLAAAFELMSYRDTDFLSALEPAARRSTRAAMIEVVLSTDLASNGAFIKRAHGLAPRGAGADAPWPLAREAVEHPTLALTVAVKFADIGHALKPFAQHEAWSALVTEEFWKIGDREKALGVPVGFLCDRDADTNMAKAQIGFFKFICRPFYKAVERLVDARKGPFDNLDTNLWRWFLISKGEAAPPPSKSARRTRRASAAILRAHIEPLTPAGDAENASPARSLRDLDGPRGAAPPSINVDRPPTDRRGLDAVRADLLSPQPDSGSPRKNGGNRRRNSDAGALSPTCSRDDLARRGGPFALGLPAKTAFKRPAEA